jgi:cAMP phosphodiesterase
MLTLLPRVTDSISKKELNLDIWKLAAPKIAAGKLNIIFLECSYPVRPLLLCLARAEVS